MCPSLVPSRKSGLECSPAHTPPAWPACLSSAHLTPCPDGPHMTASLDLAPGPFQRSCDHTDGEPVPSDRVSPTHPETTGETHSHLIQLILSSVTSNHLFPHLWLPPELKKKKTETEAIGEGLGKVGTTQLRAGRGVAGTGPPLQASGSERPSGWRMEWGVWGEHRHSLPCLWAPRNAKEVIPRLCRGGAFLQPHHGWPLPPFGLGPVTSLLWDSRSSL